MISARSRRSRSLWICVLAFWLLVAVRSFCSDWPTYHHDNQRSGVTDEKLSFPMKLAWSYTCAQPPAPAWPEQLKLINRVDFDYAPQLAIAGGLICFGSSSDDVVRALDVATGREKWHFIAGGPVRIAPAFANGKVYFAADDGVVYCLNVADGKLIWAFHAAPRDERMIGNHRMISRWPVRTGVLVADGPSYAAANNGHAGSVAYCVAGLWGAEGVFVHALQADTGKTLWCNDTSGSFKGMSLIDFVGMGINGHHQGEFGAGGSNPQGALLTGDQVLLIPNGFAEPTPLDRRTGKSVFWEPGGPPGSGGTWMTIDGTNVYYFAKHGQGGNVLMVAPNSLATGGGGRPWGVNKVPQLSIGPELKPTEVHEKGKVSAIVHDGKLHARKAYGMVLAGTTLILGHDGTVTAEKADPVSSAELKLSQSRLKSQAALPDPSGVKAALPGLKPNAIKLQDEAEIWRADVQGEAREIAVADGRLFVATHRGVIYCFEPASQHQASPTTAHDPGAALRSARLPAPSGMAAQMVNELRQAGLERGYALVLGDQEGQISTALAAQTRLHVINTLTDESAAAGLRERILMGTTWHGSRIHVQTAGRLDRLPFAQYFANAVIVAGPVPGLSGKELYRVLHPCGGTMFFPGLKSEEAALLTKEAGIPEQEIRRVAGGMRVVRGKLSDALDWNSAELKADQRVKWPLRPLWFGGPGTLQVQNFRQGADGPTVANGRYFIKGENCMTAVDAYNGAILWTRPIPKQWPGIRSVDGVLYSVSEQAVIGKGELRRSLRVNEDSVYLALSKVFFRGQGEAWIQLDARTGEQKKIYGIYLPPTSVSLAVPQARPVEVDSNHSGAVTLEKTERGLVVTLTTKDPAVTKLDAWDLFFDLRPPEMRYGLYEHGVFHVRIAVAPDENTSPSWTLETGSAAPQLDLLGAREADGTRTVATLPWTEIQRLLGTKPSSFGFAVTLNSHDGGRDEPIVRRHLFGDWTADGLNNGWASVALDPESPAMDAGKPPSVIAGSFKDLKDRTGAVTMGGKSLADPLLQSPRIHPLTGEPGPKVYRPSTLCGGSFFSASVMSGRAAVYDFEDDSGLRFMGGVKTRCTTPQVVALGLILISEETGHCSCNYPMRTSLALAPAERRLNEDWAIFHDREVDTQVRQAAINLGAPGDRRDDNGTLWLGFPRAPGAKAVGYSLAAGTQSAVSAKGVWLRFTPAVFQVPLEVKTIAGPDDYRPEEDSQTYWKWNTHWMPNRRQKNFGPYRVNADRVEITGTDRPWIYASNYRGIQTATLKLNFLKPLASTPCEKPPVLEGKLDDPGWKGDPQAVLPFTKTEVFLRHDSENLYIAARRPAVVNRLGKISPWARSTSGEDAAVWNDDSWELFLSDADSGRVIHLGVSASGARYDALADAMKKEDPKWNAAWKSVVAARDDEMEVKVAIPWKTLAESGLKKDKLSVNFQINQKDVSGEALKYPGNAGRNYASKETSGEALCNLGLSGRERCEHFVPLGIGTPPSISPRPFTVRLHFAELDDVKPGQRVFDVRLQGQVVLKDFDVLKEAGAVRTALVKEFKNIQAAEALTVEFLPARKALTAATAPILNALEVYDEDFKVASKSTGTR